MSLLVVIVLAKAVLFVPATQVWIIERAGRFRAVAQPGVQVVVPFVDRVARRMDVREQVMTLGDRQLPTGDHRQRTVAATVRYQVVDARAAGYGIADPHSLSSSSPPRRCETC